ncbi:hypothetical protein SEA_ATUIN_253 [Arthrobacter phage Atuin]|nr:hypothetical protein SEA_ATUIN_52 [Arthrobacter phage Atuin]
MEPTPIAFEDIRIGDTIRQIVTYDTGAESTLTLKISEISETGNNKSGSGFSFQKTRHPRETVTFELVDRPEKPEWLVVRVEKDGAEMICNVKILTESDALKKLDEVQELYKTRKYALRKVSKP